MITIKLEKHEMDILLASKEGGLEKVKKCIFQVVYGLDDVDYEDKDLTIIYWLEKTVHKIAEQEYKQRVGCSYKISEYLTYIEQCKRLYKEDMSMTDGVITFLTHKLRECRFRLDGIDIFEIGK